MIRARLALCSIVVAITALGGSSRAQQQAASRAAEAPELRPEVIVARALRSNPLTAPYAINVTWQGGTVVLSGRVGTKQIHDAAVRTAIAFGYPFRDDLVIDTAETMRVAMTAPPAGAPGYGPVASSVTNPYYVYPEPLFGWLDDPFFGMQPPVVSFAPWWRARRPLPPAAPPVTPPMAPTPVSGTSASPAVPPESTVVVEPPPPKGDVEITVDANGQVFLRGVVASEEIAREIEQTAWNVPGVSRVFTQLQVRPRRAGVPAEPEPPPRPEPVAPGPRGEDVPPPPTPAAPPEAVKAEAPPPGEAAKTATTAVATRDGHPLTRRVGDALRRRPTLSALPIQVRGSGDSILLSGKVPSAYEAMLAFRAAQQTPGVRDVVDRLEFSIPDEDHPNPLVRKARPQDLEPYLLEQISRHLGDLAHVDTVRARGDHLEIRGTILDAGDRDRILAILRSIPVLHGFQLDTTFTTD